VSPVRYELGFYIPEDGILQISICFRSYCSDVWVRRHQDMVRPLSEGLRRWLPDMPFAAKVVDMQSRTTDKGRDLR
jgi:hypothetical protein